MHFKVISYWRWRKRDPFRIPWHSKPIKKCHNGRRAEFSRSKQQNPFCSTKRNRGTRNEKPKPNLDWVKLFPQQQFHGQSTKFFNYYSLVALACGKNTNVSIIGLLLKGGWNCKIRTLSPSTPTQPRTSSAKNYAEPFVKLITDTFNS
jgi:hypothetical protein